MRISFLSLFLIGGLIKCSSQNLSDQEELQANAYAQISQSHFNEKRYAEALAAMDRALTIDPQNPYYLMSKGLIFFKMAKNNDAAHWVSTACQKKSEFPECWNNLSVIYNAQRKHQEALTQADKALSTPTYATPEFAYVNKAEALLGLKRNFEAKSTLKKALHHWPQDCGLRLHLVRAQMRDQAYEDGLEVVNFTTKLCPYDPLPSLWQAYVFYKIGNSSKSRYSLEKVIRQFPKSSSEEWARGALEKLEQKVPLEEPPVDIEKGV